MFDRGIRLLGVEDCVAFHVVDLALALLAGPENWLRSVVNRPRVAFELRTSMDGKR
jgi:hypothetical protein